MTYCLRHREDLAPSPEPEIRPRFEEENGMRLLEELVSYDEDIDNKSSVNHRRSTGEDKPNPTVQIVTLNTETRV